MDRILRALPWGVVAILLALAVVSVRSATDGPAVRGLSEDASAVWIAADRTAQTGGAAPPGLIRPEESARRLPTIDHPSQLVLTTGFPMEQTSSEAVNSPGPDLVWPSPPLERLPSAYQRPVESFPEMPLAESKETQPRETKPAASAPKPAEPVREASGPMTWPMAMADSNRIRSPQLEQVARQADGQIRHGFELAGRGAYFAARSEFIGALRLVAEGLDTEQETSLHGRALAAALLAMKEAEDFLPGGSRLEADLDLAGIVAGHSTPVLKERSEQATPMTALKCYFTFAQEQFSAAAGREVAGSMALHALGKLHGALAQKKGVSVVAPQAKAMVFYQAAMLVYPKNYMAANDLGVLLAQCGNYAEARAMLEHSLSICRQSTGWQNLAVVYQQLGQAGLSVRASQQATLLRQAELARRRMSSAVANDLVRWVDPQTFAQTSTNTPASPGVLPAPTNTAAPPAEPNRPLSAGQPTAAVRSAPGWYSPTPAGNRTAWEPSAYQNR
jgi:tetratricopeptide (TPR) repeat protein